MCSRTRTDLMCARSRRFQIDMSEIARGCRWSLRAPLGGHIARGAGRGRGGAARRPREPWPRRRPPSWECGGSSACARISPATPRRSRRSTASARSSRCGRTRARGRAFARGAPARVRATRAACAAGPRARRRHHAGNRSRCNGVRCERAPRACPTCGVLGLSLGRLRESTGGGTAPHFFS